MDQTPVPVSAGALSSAMQYVANPRSVKSKAFTHKFPTTNGSEHAGGTRSEIAIPTGSGTGYLNTSLSTISFTIKNKETSGGQSLHIDQSAASCIKRIDIYSAGTLVESIDEYGVAVHLFSDIQQNAYDRVCGSALASGAAPLESLNLHATGPANTDLTIRKDIQSTLKKGASIAAEKELRVCMPLHLSGVLGPGLNKYLPLNALKAGPLVLHITWASLAEAFVGSATANWVASDVSYNGHIVDVAPEVEAMIDAATPIKFISSASYRYFSGTIGQNDTAAVLPLAARFSSVNGVFMSYRNQAAAIDGTAPSLSNRSTAKMTEYSLRVGSQVVPNQPVKVDGQGAEVFQEVMKALHSVSSTAAHTSIVPGEFLEDNATSDSDRGSFVFAMETESLSHRGDSMFSGMNTLNVPVFLEAKFNTCPAPMILDAYVNYSLLLQIGRDGVLRALF